MKRVVVILAALLILSSAVRASELTCLQSKKSNRPVPYPYDFAVAAHRTQLEQLPSTAGVLLIGDSHAHLWPGNLWEGLTAHHAALAGDLIEHVLWRLHSPQWQTLQPANVILVVGTNNLARGDCAFAIIEGIAALLSQAKRLWPNSRLFFVGIPPRDMQGPLRPAERIAINAILRSHLTTKNVHFVDAERLLGYPRFDQVHYPPEAYRALMPDILPLLAENPLPR
jgi:hypothetical protein